MINPWYGMALLAMESSSVVCLRLMQMAGGGSEAQSESHLMVSEKIAASMEATMTLMTGGTLDTVIRRYREQVAANADRLTTSLSAGAALPSLPLA